jgi:hypothetical protein
MQWKLQISWKSNSDGFLKAIAVRPKTDIAAIFSCTSKPPSVRSPAIRRFLLTTGHRNSVFE